MQSGVCGISYYEDKVEIYIAITSRNYKLLHKDKIMLQARFSL